MFGQKVRAAYWEIRIATILEMFGQKVRAAY
jgi:hypothetical protein